VEDLVDLEKVEVEVGVVFCTEKASMYHQEFLRLLSVQVDQLPLQQLQVFLLLVSEVEIQVFFNLVPLVVEVEVHILTIH
jgi:hypothetical protein